MRKILPIRAFFLLIALFFLSSSLAFATSTLCEEQQPLLEFRLGPFDPPPGSTVISLGEWRLPLSGDRPHELTDAKLRLELRREPEQSEWYLITFFHYDTAPDIVGLPFTFQKILLNWVNLKDLTGTDRLDWSNQCQEPGRSIMPGQKFTEQLRLNGASNRIGIKTLTIKLWGSQN